MPINPIVGGALVGAGSGVLGMLGQRNRERRTMRNQEHLMGIQHRNQQQLNQQHYHQPHLCLLEKEQLAWDMASNPSKYTGSQSGPSTTPAYTMFRDEDTPGYNEVIAGLNMAEYSEEPGRRMDESETEYRDRLRRLVDFQHDRRTIPDEA